MTHEVVNEAISQFRDANPHMDGRTSGFREQIGGVVGSTVSAAGTGLRMGAKGAIMSAQTLGRVASNIRPGQEVATLAPSN